MSKNNSNYPFSTNNLVFTKYENSPIKQKYDKNNYQWYNINKKDNTNQIIRNDDKGVSIEFDSYHINRKEFPNSKRVLVTKYQDDVKNDKSCSNVPYSNAGSWNSLMNKTSGEESILSKNRKFCNKSTSKTYQSDVFPNPNVDINEKLHFLKALYSDHKNKTQITTLPGGIKWDKYQIKDDLDFRIKNNEAHKYKMKRDFNSDLDYNKSEPIGTGYNINEYPTEKRFQGSYKRFQQDNDIFNLKGYCENDIDKPRSKRLFADNRSFKSQIEFC